jgi:hypothetical protein
MGRYGRQFDGELRTAHFSLQLTPFERAELDRKAEAAALSPADYVRLRCFSAHPHATTQPRLSREAGREIAAELARLGNNVNQLARHANATGDFPSRQALDAAIERIVKATEKLITL